MTGIIEPPVPADLDLRDFAFMPLDVARLRDSGLVTCASGDAFRAAVLLWCASWHQVPCSSVADEDRELASLAGYGRDIRGWRKVRADALRGWVKADDGRLYHPVVAEKAIEGWIEKLAQRKISAAGNAKLSGVAFDPGPHDEAMEAAKARLFALNPRSRALNKKGKRYSPGHPGGTKEAASVDPPGTPNGLPNGIPDGPPKDIPERPQETGKGQGQGQGHLSLSAAGGGSGARDDAYRRFVEAHPAGSDEPDGVRRELGRRLDQGVPLDEILAGARRYADLCRSESRTGKYIGSPTKWLVEGKWHNGKPKPEAALPVVVRGTPQGEAWAEHLGPKAMWADGKRTVPAEWPPGREPSHAEAAA